MAQHTFAYRASFWVAAPLALVLLVSACAPAPAAAPTSAPAAAPTTAPAAAKPTTAPAAAPTSAPAPAAKPTTAPAAAPTTAPAAAKPTTAPAPAAAGGSKQVIILMPSSTNNYLAEYERGVKLEADKLGLQAKIIENDFKQEEQDVQVQQVLAAGDKPAAYVWWPADNAAGVASLKKLHDTGVPVIMANQLPTSDGAPLIAMYAGVDDVLNGQTSGKLAIEARDLLKKNGVQLHSPGGNVLIVMFPAGYSAGTDRLKGFKDVTKDANFNILDTQPAGFDETKGYEVGSQMIVANKSKGIDLVYATNDALASGVIQALEEQGYTPGKDVMVIGGTCHGNLTDLTSGKQFGTGLQAARLEGVFTIDSVQKFLTAGKVQDGEYRPAADPNKLPPVEGAPFKFNFIPNPAVHSSEVESTKLYGFTMKELCTY